MFHLQLKQVRVAIDAGRLDEAFESLDRSKVRDHRDAQRLVDHLVDALLERGKCHLDAGRVPEAKADADRAWRLAGSMEKVSELRWRVSLCCDQQNEIALNKHNDEKAAEVQVKLGNLTLGEKLLPSSLAELNNLTGKKVVERKVSGQQAPSRLGEEIRRLRILAEDVADRVAGFVDAGEILAAVSIVDSAESAVRQHRLVTQQLKKLVDPTIEDATKELCSGRLDRANRLVNLIRPIAQQDPRWIELDTVIEECRHASQFISDGNHTRGIVSLRRVENALGKQRWLTEAIRAVEQIQEATLVIQSGPLGLTESLSMTNVDEMSQQQTMDAAARVPSIVGGNSSADESLETVLLLRVDGVGSILLLSSPTITIGSGSTSKRFDVPLLTDGPEDPLYIRRTGEDYFIESKVGFELNATRTRRHLLKSGDSINFGQRGRLRFIRSVAASGSAVLRLSGAGLPRREIRHLALMDDSLVFSTEGGHFPLPQGDAPVVLFLSPEGYALKYAGVGGEHRKLVLGETVLFGETRFSLNHVNLT